MFSNVFSAFKLLALKTGLCFRTEINTTFALFSANKFTFNST